MIDRHWPIVASHVPIKLVVILEEAGAVANRVVNLNGATGIHRVRDEDLQVAEAVGRGRFVFELAAIAVRHASDIQEKRVVRSPRPWIFDRDEAVNAMPLADECQRNTLMDCGRTVLMDGNGVVEIGDTPAAGKEGRNEEDEKKS